MNTSRIFFIWVLIVGRSLKFIPSNYKLTFSLLIKGNEHKF